MKVSVIIANYNYQQYLPAAINSVLAQGYTDYEIIVVDDGSTDNSREILADFESRLPSEKFNVIFQENQGHGGAINTGFQNSTGEIVATLDSDDVWQPDKLEKVMRHFQQPDVVGVIHPLNFIDAEGSVTSKSVTPFKIPNGDLARIILETGCTWHYTCGLTFRRIALQKILPMEPPEWRFWPDGCLLYCAAFLGKIVAVNEALGSYRIHGKNTFFYSGNITPERKAKAIAGVEMTSQWLNQFLERIDYSQRVDLSRNLDYRRANYYFQESFNSREMLSITKLILGWYFGTGSA